MTVESATYISQLNTAQPTASDNISEGDDHLRLIKSVLQAQFPNLGTAAARPTATQLNKLGFQTGMIIMWSSAAAPTTETISGVKDWLLCNGDSYDAATYSDLYSVIGTTYGSDGADFLVPDFRTYFPVGVGTGFTLGSSGNATATAGTDVLKYIPMNFLIKT